MVLILWKTALRQIPIILTCVMKLELLKVERVVKDGPVEVPKDVEENRVENLKEKVQRKREDVKGNVQRKDVENVVVNYI